MGESREVLHPLHSVGYGCLWLPMAYGAPWLPMAAWSGGRPSAADSAAGHGRPAAAGRRGPQKPDPPSPAPPSAGIAQPRASPASPAAECHIRPWLMELSKVPLFSLVWKKRSRFGSWASGFAVDFVQGWLGRPQSYPSSNQGQRSVLCSVQLRSATQAASARGLRRRQHAKRPKPGKARLSRTKSSPAWPALAQGPKASQG